MSKILTFEDFKQQVAEKYGWKTFEDLEKDYRITINKEKEYLIEASELYAQYQREEGKKEGYKQGYEDSIYQLRSNNDHLAFNKGWNEALHWAAEQHGISLSVTKNRSDIYISKQSILKGLKEDK